MYIYVQARNVLTIQFLTVMFLSLTYSENYTGQRQTRTQSVHFFLPFSPWCLYNYSNSGDTIVTKAALIIIKVNPGTVIKASFILSHLSCIIIHSIKLRIYRNFLINKYQFKKSTSTHAENSGFLESPLIVFLYLSQQ